jgi:hypothetical protein
MGESQSKMRTLELQSCVPNRWEVSSVGRASPLQGECRRFETVTSYQDFA